MGKLINLESVNRSERTVIPAMEVWQSLGVSRETGYRILRRGLLEKTHLGGKLFITRVSLDRLTAAMLRKEVGSPLLQNRGRRPKAPVSPSATSPQSDPVTQ